MPDAPSTERPSRERTRSRARWWLAPAIALGCVGLGSCSIFLLLLDMGEPLPTVDGPEHPEALEGTSGTLVIGDGYFDYDELRLISLPSLAEETIALEQCPDRVADAGRAGSTATRTANYCPGGCVPEARIVQASPQQ